MTSKQVMLTLALSCLAALTGCASHDTPARLYSPYPARQVWAVVPLRNESGSLHADGTKMADHLAQQIEQVQGIDVLPVNRVLDAMRQLHMQDVRTRDQAIKLRRTLGADGLVIGTISAYEPYDPPKMGMAIELYDQTQSRPAPRVDPQKLTEAATEGQVAPPRRQGKGPTQPVDQVSGYYDAANPYVRAQLKQYAQNRGDFSRGPSNWRLYRLSMNLYSEFVSHAMTAKLIQAEHRRVNNASPDAKPPAP